MPKRIPGTDSRFLDLLRLLQRHRVKYILVGGVAANLHGHVRATKDIDLLVPRDLENMARLLEALSELPYGIAREWSAEELMERPITIIGDDPRVDILTSAGGVSFGKVKGVTRKIQGVPVVYLTIEDLIRSKETGRTQDKADIEALRGIAGKRKGT